VSFGFGLLKIEEIGYLSIYSYLKALGPLAIEFIPVDDELLSNRGHLAGTSGTGEAV
jgi:hypothetical protein